MLVIKIAVISGGSSGIGRACIDKLISGNYFVYNLDIKDIQTTYDSQLYKWINADVSKQEQISQAVNQIINKNQKIDLLVVSAGLHLSANIENTNDNDLINVVNINLFGAFWLIKAVIPHMKQNNYGNIVTIGSDQSSIVKPNSTVYGMTKAALASLSKSVALDYAKYNIRVNCIAAGTIDTPLYRKAIENYANKTGISLEQIEMEEANQQPLGRIGKPEEIANLVYFIAEDTAGFMTGAVIPIDGGYTLG